MEHLKKGTIIKIALGILLVCILVISFWRVYEPTGNRNPLYIKPTLEGDNENDLLIIPLKMYVVGEQPEDFQLVLKEVNDRLNTLIGVELTVDFISEKDVSVDYHTIFAGGADFDLIGIYPYYYNEFTSKYAYMNLTEDMLRKCAPQVSINELDPVRINQMVYTVPSKSHLENSIVLLVRGDIAKAYGINHIQTIDELERYMGLVKNNEENIMPLDVGFNGLKLMQLLCTQPNNIRIYDNYFIGIQETNNKSSVMWLPESNFFKDYLDTIKTWKKFKYIPEQASSKRIVLNDSFIEGSSAIAIGQVFDMENLKRAVESAHPEYEPKLIALGNELLNSYYEPVHHGISIKNGSQHAAKSLMLVEQLRTNEEIFRLLNYGIEGIHYHVTQDNYYEPLVDSIKYPIYNNPIWCMTDQYRLKYRFQNELIVPFDQIKEPSLQMYSASMNLDVLDLTQLEAVQKNYGYPLTLGEFDNMYTSINEYVNEMEAVGFRYYYKEVKTKIESNK